MPVLLVTKDMDTLSGCFHSWATKIPEPTSQPTRPCVSRVFEVNSMD